MPDWRPAGQTSPEMLVLGYDPSRWVFRRTRRQIKVSVQAENPQKNPHVPGMLGQTQIPQVSEIGTK